MARIKKFLLVATVVTLISANLFAVTAFAGEIDPEPWGVVSSVENIN